MVWVWVCFACCGLVLVVSGLGFDCCDRVVCLRFNVGLVFGVLWGFGLFGVCFVIGLFVR